jgi:hypothetical protein
MTFDTRATTSAVAASEAGFTFEPQYPQGGGIGATITVCGPESQAARILTRAQLRRLQSMELAAKKEGRATDHFSLVLSQDIDEAPRQKAETAAAYTLGWSGFTEGDVALAPTADNYRAIYLAHPWIADQVIAQAQDLGNFIKPSSASCSPTLPPSSGST